MSRAGDRMGRAPPTTYGRGACAPPLSVPLVLASLLAGAGTRAAAQPPAHPDAGARTAVAAPRADASMESTRSVLDASAPTTGDAGAPGDGSVVDAAVAGAGSLPAEHRPDLSLELDPEDGIATGDAVTLSVRAVVPEGTDVAVPEQDFAPFEILEKDHRVRDAGGGKRAFEFELDLLALQPGEAKLGPVALRVVTAGGVVGRVRTEPVRIRVESVLGNEPNPEPKGRTEPVPVMEKDYTLLWILGGIGAVVLTAIATLLIARWWRRRPKPPAPAPPPRPPWDVALGKLQALRRDRSAAVEEGRVEEWADRLSDTMREYFGHRYGFEGLESTTDEVIARLRNVRLRGTSIPEVSSILGECDLVKFARATLDESRFDALLDEAVRIVHNTMPGPDEGTGPAPDGKTAGDGGDATASRSPDVGTGGEHAGPRTGTAPPDHRAPARDADGHGGGGR